MEIDPRVEADNITTYVVDAVEAAVEPIQVSESTSGVALLLAETGAIPEATPIWHTICQCRGPGSSKRSGSNRFSGTWGVGMGKSEIKASLSWVSFSGM